MFKSAQEEHVRVYAVEVGDDVEEWTMHRFDLLIAWTAQDVFGGAVGICKCDAYIGCSRYCL